MKRMDIHPSQCAWGCYSRDAINSSSCPFPESPGLDNNWHSHLLHSSSLSRGRMNTGTHTEKEGKAGHKPAGNKRETERGHKLRVRAEQMQIVGRVSKSRAF